MNKMLCSALLICCLFISSCASHMPGKSVSFEDGKHPSPMPVHAEISEELSNESHTVLFLHFKNEGHDWLTVKENSFQLTDADVIPYLDAKDYLYWKIREEKVDSRQRQGIYALLLGLGLIVMTVAALKGNSTATAAGGATYVGATTAAVIEEEKEKDMSLETRLHVKEEHYLTKSFKIPPGPPVTKWVLIKKGVKQVKRELRFALEYDQFGPVKYLSQMSSSETY